MEENKIKEALVNDFNISERTLTDIEKLKKHNDIYLEFIEFLEKNIYKDGAKSGVWTAKSLSEELSHLDPIIIFEFLVGLREEPEKYEGYIAEGAMMI